MKQTGYPVIDEILESLRPQAPSSTSTVSDRELALDELAFELCYAAIRRSGLYAQLECGEWDALAERMRGQVRSFIDEQIDAELTRIESES